MAFDTIVFSQDELERALCEGITSIGLCDGCFILPKAAGITYTAIGSVSTRVYSSEKEFERLSVTYIGFTPEFIAPPRISSAARIIRPSSGSGGSYRQSSYFMTSYTLMYEYEYEYEYVTSFSESSFVSSYTPFRTSFREGTTCVMVNGYGINLI